MSDINNLEDIIPDLSSDLNESFQSFFELLEQYNKKINLVSRSSIPHAGVKHFSDCYQALQILEDDLAVENPIFDFGSGNGFPGIIAAIMYPKSQFILVEKDKRKAQFLKTAYSELELNNVEVHAGTIAELNEGVCQTIISRAMAPLPKFLLETRKFTKLGGTAFLLKGDHWSTEFSAIPPQVFQYWDVSLMKQYFLPNNAGSRVIVRCLRV